MIVLDTCAALWTVEQATMTPGSLEAIEAAVQRRELFVSPFVAWEVTMLVSKRRLQIADGLAWFERLAARPGARLAPLDAALLAQSNSLPGSPPNDPADRIMIASALRLGAKLVTRDEPIRRYGADGYVDVLVC